jgi:Zn finger protein HypA/HybF involved in hydrogenase expression
MEYNTYKGMEGKHKVSITHRVEVECVECKWVWELKGVFTQYQCPSCKSTKKGSTPI